LSLLGCESVWVVSSMLEDCRAFTFYGWTFKVGASHQAQNNIPQYSHPQGQLCENLKSLSCLLPLFHYITFSPWFFLAHPLSQSYVDLVAYISTYIHAYIYTYVHNLSICNILRAPRLYIDVKHFKRINTKIINKTVKSHRGSLSHILKNYVQEFTDKLCASYKHTTMIEHIETYLAI